MHHFPLYYGGMEGATRARRRFKPRGRHPDKALSAAFVRSAAPGRYCDGQGLYLFVQPSGTRSWVQRIAIRGRRHELGLGSTALVPLAEARAKALANRKIAREGGDPLAEKRRAETTPTFCRRRRSRAGTETGRMEQLPAREHLDSQPGNLRLPADRRATGVRGDQRRRPGGPDAHLAREGADRPAGAPARPRGAGMGRGDGAEARQPVRPHRAGPRTAAGARAAHAGAAASRRAGGRCGRPDFGRGPCRQAGVSSSSC